MLRESGKIDGREYQLAGAIDAAVDSGVEHGRELVEFTAAVANGDDKALLAARSTLVEKMDPGAVVSASLIAANFSMLDRIANAIGVSLDEMMLKGSEDIRESLGINAYPSAANSIG